MRNIALIAVAFWLLFLGGFSTVRDLTAQHTSADVVTTIERGAQTVVTAPQIRVTAFAVPTMNPPKATIAPKPTAQIQAQLTPTPALAESTPEATPDFGSRPIEDPVEPVAITPIETLEQAVPNGDGVVIPKPALGQCLHGQVFTDRGCKNPNSKHRSKSTP